MFRKLLAGCISLAVAASVAAAGENTPPRAGLSGTAIADKNVAARGGLQAWRSVQSMSLAGKLGAGGNKRATLPVPGTQKATEQAIARRPADEVLLPFVMELKRPRKMRFELQFKGQTAVQVFDGVNGWKFRPFLNRRDVEPYTSDEMKMASRQADIEGPLIDYAVKGTLVELAGMEKIEDRDTYKLKLSMKSGEAINVWIDARTFLETKMQGQPRRLDGTDHPVEVYFRDYRPVNGLVIPYVLETKVLQVAQNALGLKDPPVPAEKTIIEKVMVNPKLDETLFSKAGIGTAPLPN